ncbi:RNA helicase [Ranunculus cassubicifolius]
MASGFPSGGGGDFYNSTTSFGGGNGAYGSGYGGGALSGGTGSSMMNNVQLHQYRQQQIHHLQQDQYSSSSSLIPPRRNTPASFGLKRPISELERHQQHQQSILLRSVKQRSNQYNHTSPISPFDFSGNHHHQNNNFSSNTHHHQLQQLRSSFISANPNTIINTNNMYNSNGYTITNNPSLSSNSFTSNHLVKVETVESEKKIKNQLQELEKALLDDNDDDEDDKDAVSIVTSSEWSETMQSLIQTPNQPTPKPFSPSPSSSSSSSSASSSSPMNSTSSKQSFVEIATAISEGNMEIATVKLDHLKQISNPQGDSEQRLISYMVSALRSKLNPSENPPPVTELFNGDQIMATQMLYEASPCFKYGFMASNIAILEATKDDSTNVHVLDFDIGLGSQYLHLIHLMGERQQAKGIPIMIRITSVVLDSSFGAKEDDQRLVGDRLKKLADRVGVGFKFNMVYKGITELTREALCFVPNEALVVNFAFRLFKLSDESVSTENHRDELQRFVKGLNPRVVTLVEQEMNCNTAPFVARVAEVSSYYLALFNSLDSTLSRDRLERVKIEECLGRKAANSVACEGRERVERCEVFGKWRARMRMAGFAPRPFGQHVAESLKAKLCSVYKNINGFTVKEEANGICFGWNDRVLTVASSWC